MNLKEIIDHVDTVRPNAFSNLEKVVWLNEVESEIQRDVLMRKDVRAHVWSREWAGKVTIADSRTMICDGHLEAWSGGRVKVAGLDDLMAKPGEEMDTLNAEERAGSTVLTFPEGSFTGTGQAEASLTYDGSGEEMAAPPFFAKIYYTYLEGRICAAEREWQEYANVMQLYNKYLNELCVWYAREYIDKRGEVHGT